ncbi:uncharacterized protein C6orf163-like [Watersipora subatra]|uniref:uncharacterized protein C6orf163-like n=1 Tax=Watersipora subatra TaxID=2589382 RepID=UPI00355AEA7E
MKAPVSDSSDASVMEVVRARKVCTVPQQLLKSYELPALRNSRTVPKRYEETKPVKVQNFTHQRIMDLGELINRQTREESVKLQQVAVEKAVAETWEAAKELKIQAVREALDEAKVQHEKQLQQLRQQHERSITEKTLAVQTKMQNKMREMIEAEKIQAAAELKATVEQVKEKCSLELQEAVESARIQELKVAEQERKQLLQEAAEKLAKTREALATEQDLALAAFDKKKENEKAAAVLKAQTAEKEVGAAAVAAVQRQHVVEIEKLEKAIISVHKKVEKKEKEVARVQTKREQLYDELIKVQANYQEFIDRHPMFDPGQSRYLLLDVESNPNVVNPRNDVPSTTHS